MYLITSNKNKLAEFKYFLPNIEQFEIDLPEIQEIDSQKVISHKLNSFDSQVKKPFIVEDTSLYLEVFNYKFPGPLIKWYLLSIGNEEIFNICSKLNKFNAIGVSTIGYSDINGNKKIFEGKLNGKIVSPKGSNGWGWDMAFEPNEMNKTLAEISLEEKMQMSHRAVAIKKLTDYLNI